MPYLGDYLGQLLSEVTIARVHADLEAVRVAELYASHPLLKTMPVPHFRLPDVQLEVPVVIKQVDEPRPGESPRGGADLPKLRKTFDSVLARQLLKDRRRMSAAETRALRAALARSVAAVEQPAEVAIDTNRMADRMADAAAEALGAGVAPGDAAGQAAIARMRDELKSAARVAFLKTRTPPPRLGALVTTQEVREAGPGETVTRLRLRVSEEAVEWSAVESDGETKERLIPE